ncbi:hypothetical protein niasHT_015523 [Heterodera trifolii]|uniref:CTP synthase n=1 Tax=Heterodera trifolii TaxID=157864 RepID=A0ABD2L0B0_9BILA
MAEEPVKLILVTGGVMSGVGKGIVSSSIGVLLKGCGYRVTVIKIDPYINVDAGTFSPFEHGEVFVLDDGGEVDLDLGNYERFLDIRLTRDNNITTGKIFHQVIQRERNGDYLGKISVDGSGKAPQICIVELGGTIGDIEGMPYTMAFSMAFRRKTYRNRFLTVHVTKLLHESGEIKTKPAQNGLRSLRETGLYPDLLLCRSQKPLTQALRSKIASFAQLDINEIIDVYDCHDIHSVPLLLLQQQMKELLISQLQLPDMRTKEDFSVFYRWQQLSENAQSQEEVRIALVAKYVCVDSGTVFTDAYASVIKALSHAAICASRKINIRFVSAEHLEAVENGHSVTEHKHAWAELRGCHGILVPGGFGNRGVEGKIEACRYARENNIPFLGICLGLQCAAIEFARNVCGIEGANSTEFVKNLSSKQQVVVDMPEHAGEKYGMGATMRLGKRTTVFLAENSLIRKLYKNKLSVDERHRHRYEVNPSVVPKLTEKGLLFVGLGIDENCIANGQQNGAEQVTPSAALLKIVEKNLAENDNELAEKVEKICGFGANGSSFPGGTAIRMEMAELPRNIHPFFAGVQYHPEYLSSPFRPSPLFFGLLLAASGQLEAHLCKEMPSLMVGKDGLTISAENALNGREFGGVPISVEPASE